MHAALHLEEPIYFWAKISFAVFYKVTVFAILPLNLGFIAYYITKVYRILQKPPSKYRRKNEIKCTNKKQKGNGNI